MSDKRKKHQENFKKAVAYAKEMMKKGNHKTIAEGIKEYFHKLKNKDVKKSKSV